MYRLMKSEKFTFEHVIYGSMSSYRQTEVDHFLKFLTAVEACEVANNEGRLQFYVLNESGQEYYGDTWID